MRDPERKRPSVHIVGGGMGGDRWFWVVTVGRYPHRRSIADGMARGTAADAQREADSAIATLSTEVPHA
jgi:hypothetical protein